MMYIALIVLEVILALFGAWCILNEKKLLAFEEHIGKEIRRRINRRRREKACRYLAENGLVAVPVLADNEDIVIMNKRSRFNNKRSRYNDKF